MESQVTVRDYQQMDRVLKEERLIVAKMVSRKRLHHPLTPIPLTGATLASIAPGPHIRTSGGMGGEVGWGCWSVNPPS